MSQTSIIFAALLAAFIVFITTRGELVQYLQVIGLSAGTPCPGQTASSNASSSATPVANTSSTPQLNIGTGSPAASSTPVTSVDDTITYNVN